MEGCFVLLALIVIGVVWSMMRKLGSFSVVDVGPPMKDAKSLSRYLDPNLKHMAIPSRLVVRCDQCKTQWEPKVIADVLDWKDRPFGLEDGESSMSPYAVFEPSQLVVGHTGPQPTEPAFKLVCPNRACSYRGKVTKHEIESFLKKAKNPR